MPFWQDRLFITLAQNASKSDGLLRAAVGLQTTI
ncbi:hypothetical protein Rleg4DRAFT_6049 [Rhizobium leguminosarum bv. trifolii WSM2297]|uniref:Uncharacterized protein n=1 Tax=Rhizobium leguminosarum bv. trifolii WSM2297 TaxID=754762 RepID=J0L233_RHILT|nr:hypothetical protein Rleg4DRAFT_6049 [Rhizobium leguminosarum bv. trifolii WSM2297]